MHDHAPPEAATAEDYARAFAAFQLQRKPNTNAIADMAFENYVELRDRVHDKAFVMKKRVEILLEKTFGDDFIPRHAMVGWGGAGNVTYSNAKQLGAVQWEIISELAKNIAYEEDVNLTLAERLIGARVTPLARELGMDVSTVYSQWAGELASLS